MRKQKGVTLIALVIPVLVLIILVGVTVNTQLGGHSQIKEIVDASKRSFDRNVVDGLLMVQREYTSKSEYYEFLKDDKYINEEGIIDVEKVIGSKDCEYGIGSDESDVYQITPDLDIFYYNKQREKELIENISATMED